MLLCSLQRLPKGRVSRGGVVVERTVCLSLHALVVVGAAL